MRLSLTEIIINSLKWIPRINLGDYVRYETKKNLVCNGIIEDKWELSNIGLVDRNKCKKVFTPLNIFRSFKNGFNFYRTYWS